MYVARRKKTIILMDYENLEKNTLNDPDKTRLGAFLDKIAKKEDIIDFLVFLPSYLSSKAISVVSNFYDAGVVYFDCPRNFLTKNGELKDKDSVDWKMTVRGIHIIDHYKNLKKIIIVGGDFDFNFLRNYGKRRGVEIQIVSAEKALAKDYIAAGAKVEIL
jgi:uncharacterized LabA/DUF88 family protein